MLIRLPADAQSGLRLCCLQTPEDRFSRIEAHLSKYVNSQVYKMISLIWVISILLLHS